jgi:hypothetical protein
MNLFRQSAIGAILIQIRHLQKFFKIKLDKNTTMLYKVICNIRVLYGESD